MTDLVRATWAVRTATEYRSAAVAAQMLHWCLVLGVDAGIVDDLHRLVADELDHAHLSREVHASAGGAVGDVRVKREQLEFGIFPAEPLERRALAAALREYAFHETLALEAFRALAKLELVPVVRAAIDRIFRDEARHRRVGWRLLDALLEYTGEREWLGGQVARGFTHVAAAYGRAGGPTPAEAAWGLVGPDEYARCLARGRRVVVARLRERGLPGLDRAEV